MKGPWKVTSQYYDGVKEFQVYRLRDTSKVDHSGNREFFGGIFSDRNDAYDVANELNNKEKDD